MSKEIYFFSGSGNSFIVARDIANKINAKLIPMASIIEQTGISTDANIVGFVFPNYASKQPRLVSKFVKKMKNINLKYIFAVSTYGLVPSKTIKYFDQLIQSCGGKLSLGFAVKMPFNSIGANSFTPQTKHEILFKSWKNKLDVISQSIIDGKKGIFETSDMFFSLMYSGLFLKSFVFGMKLIKQAIMKGSKYLDFISNEKCDSCGICIKICPVNNIEMVDNKPAWLNQCTKCNACFNWCPKEAIQFGNSNITTKQYHHPEAKIEDIMKQKTNVNY